MGIVCCCNRLPCRGALRRARCRRYEYAAGRADAEMRQRAAPGRIRSHRSSAGGRGIKGQEWEQGTSTVPTLRRTSPTGARIDHGPTVVQCAVTVAPPGAPWLCRCRMTIEEVTTDAVPRGLTWEAAARADPTAAQVASNRINSRKPGQQVPQRPRDFC